MVNQRQCYGKRHDRRGDQHIMGEKLNHMSKTDQWDKMAAQVDDDVVHLFAAVGRHDELAAAVTARSRDREEPLLKGDLPLTVAAVAPERWT